MANDEVTQLWAFCNAAFPILLDVNNGNGRLESVMEAAGVAAGLLPTKG